MGEFTGIEDHLKDFIERQEMFFVGTAAPDGRVNISPKGMESLRVMAPDRIVWLNLTGAENETAAHLAESARMTMMWCSFGLKPLILRAYGTAVAVHPHDGAWKELAALFPAIPGARQIFDLDVDFVLTSCGFAVPRYDFVGQRESLRKWAEQKGEAGLRAHWAKNNAVSLDGKPTGIFGEKN